MNSKAMNIKTNSSEGTIRIAEKISHAAFPGCFIALYGELGTGKTVFVKGLAKGLGVREYGYLSSASFVLLREYKGSMKLYHLDVYRLDEESFLNSIDHRRYFYSDGLAVVEWACRIPSALPSDRLDVEMEHGKSVNERKIRLVPRGDKHQRILKNHENISI